MALIEGVGDEVLQFLLAVVLVILAMLAWWSTQIPERSLLRTVLILERRGARQTEGETQSSPTIPPINRGNDDEDKREDETEATASENVENDGDSSPREVMHEIFSDPDPQLHQNMSIRSVSFFSQGNSSSNDEMAVAYNEYLMMDDSFPVSDVCIHSHRNAGGDQVGDDNIASANDATESQSSDANPITEPKFEVTSKPEQSIRIRLKYLNDDLKLVEGNLKEQLGDFKKRHFNIELSGRKLVRLIFKGQVLHQDTWTLGHYGMFDNCVVHCLVHHPRTPPPSPNLNTRTPVQRPAAISPWALSNVLLASLSFLLGIAWYGRYQYAQLYTATTTVALVGLTGIFTVSLIGLYMPDPLQ